MRTQYRDLKVATVASYSPTALLWILVWVALFSNLAYGQTASQNVTVPLLSNQITYIPFLCNSTAQINNPDACAGAWLTTNIPDSPSPVISSFGQDATVGNIIPQLFFRFRASTLYLNFIPNFNATFNVTLSNTNNVAITSTILSALGAATIVGIPPELITTLAITILPSDTPTEFGLLSIMMTVPVDAESTSIFPSPSLPTPSPISTYFTQTTTSFATSTITMPAQSATEGRAFVAHAVGLTVGLGLGLTAIAGLGFFWWKRRRKMQEGQPPEMTQQGPVP